MVGWSFYYISSQASGREYTLHSLHSHRHHGKFGVIYQRSNGPSYYTNSRYANEGYNLRPTSLPSQVPPQ